MDISKKEIQKVNLNLISSFKIFFFFMQNYYKFKFKFVK